MLAKTEVISVFSLPLYGSATELDTSLPLFTCQFPQCTCHPLSATLKGEATNVTGWIFNNRGVILTLIFHWLGPLFFTVMIDYTVA